MENKSKQIFSVDSTSRPPSENYGSHSDPESFVSHPRVSSDAYREIAQLSEDVTRSSFSFTGLLACEPAPISVEYWSLLQSRNDLIRSWQRKSLDLLIASIKGECSPEISASLLDHLPRHFGWDHHRRVALQNVSTPTFFRTDQNKDGKVLEVQCPGSLWGVQEILSEFYASCGFANVMPSSRLFLAALRRRLGALPVVHHLMDNSSHPAGERFFVQRARRGARYFGYDGVRPQDCNFVRSHDFPTLLVDNFAEERMKRLAAGESLYDLPPVALFDQKFLLALPFWDETREHYSEAMRGILPYTAPVSEKGLRLQDGQWITLEKFAALPRNRRRYFLKYAGSDVARNWGSRAVFHLGRLSREACESKLKEATSRWADGERWIIQQDSGNDEEVSFLTRTGECSTITAHSKHSVFYGPDGPLGTLVMFEHFYKVHASTETITTVGSLPTSTVAELPHAT